MELIHGRSPRTLDRAAFAARVAAASQVLLDIGTGDGRFVCQAARRDRRCLAIGVDACRENLRASSRSAPANALFVIANARALPVELCDSATQITINFPWGSLLSGLLTADVALLSSLRVVARPGALLEVRLNSSALAEAGVGLAHGGTRVCQSLRTAGWVVRSLVELDAAALRACPTTWAKRLAYSHDPHALYLRATWPRRELSEQHWASDVG